MVDVGYCRDPDRVQVLPGAGKALHLLADAGYLTVVVTNQSGIGRGYFNAEDLDSVHARLREDLLKDGGCFDALYYCPHRPDEACDCRKPKPGLLLRAAAELNIDLQRSYMIGDREWDIEAGKAAGSKTILLAESASFSSAARKEAVFLAMDVLDAAHFIISNTSNRTGRTQ